MTPRTNITVSYRVLDESGQCLDVIKRTGRNKRYLQWVVDRLMAHKYGRKKVTCHPFKVTEETS